ncbi:MAG: hypothetical protein JW881_20920 [Spirochaetales bacterium]|nr:hypothetical protein [Spirochaetales bacterium]
MKHVALLSFLFFFAGVFSLPADGYPVKSPAKKVVSEIRTYNWKSSRGWFEGGITKIVNQYYDDEGLLVKMEFYDKDGGLLEKTVFSYGDETIKKVTTNHDNTPVRISVVRYETDTVTETVRRTDGSLFFKTVSRFSPEGSITGLKYYNEEETLLFNKIFVYTEEGDLKHIRLYNPDGTFAVEVSIEYHDFDENGNWLSRSEYYTYADVRRRPRDKVSRSIEY